MACLTGLVATLPVGAVALAGPVAAAVPEPGAGWPEQEPVNVGHVLGFLVGIPVALAVVILALVYVPALVRGERVAPGAPPLEDQWLGGPNRPAGEIARGAATGGEGRSTAASTSSAAAGSVAGELEQGVGGASGRW